MKQKLKFLKLLNVQKTFKEDHHHPSFLSISFPVQNIPRTNNIFPMPLPDHSSTLSVFFTFFTIMLFSKQARNQHELRGSEEAEMHDVNNIDGFDLACG